MVFDVIDTYDQDFVSALDQGSRARESAVGSGTFLGVSAKNHYGGPAIQARCRSFGLANLAHAPVALTLSFLDAINRGDVTRLADLMAKDYRLTVFDESPRTGYENGVADWRGYLASFPDYIIHPHKIVGRNKCVAVLGTTPGSHLGLPDREEMKLTLIWLCQITDAKVWKLIPDTPENRQRFGLSLKQPLRA